MDNPAASYQINVPNSFLSPVSNSTPAPTPFVEPQGDPYAGLLQTLSNLTQQIQPVNQPSKLDIIMNALAQAAAVGASNDPGATLQHQLDTRTQIAQQTKAQQLQQQQKIQDMLVQVGMQKAQDLSQQQRDFRQQQFKKAADKEDEQFKIEQFNRELAGKTKLDNINFEQQKQMASIKQNYEQINEGTKNQWQKEIIEAKDLDEQKKYSLIQTVNLINGGLDVGTARRVVNSFMEDTPLSPADEKAVNAAAIRARAAAVRAARAGSGSSADSGLTEKQVYQLAFERTKTPHTWVQLPDGTKTAVETSSIKYNFAGQPMGGYKVLGPLSPSEQFQLGGTDAQNFMKAMPKGGAAFQQEPQARVVPAPAQTGGLDRLNAILSDARAKGRTVDQQRGILKANGATDAQINSLLGGYQLQGPVVTPEMLQQSQGQDAGQRLKGAQNQSPKRLPGMHEMQ